jgi:hypothetical protein
VVARLEDPDHNPTLDTLERVARALGTRLEVGLSPTRNEVSGAEVAERKRPLRAPRKATTDTSRRKRAA